MRACDYCGQSFEANRPAHRFCSDGCRAKAHKAGMTPQPTAQLPTPPSEPVACVLAATLAELQALGATSTPSGQLALSLASLIDTPPFGSLGAVAGWAREHRAALAECREAAAARPIVQSALDEVRARREAKRRGV